MEITALDLETFVAESDRRGGPGSPECRAYWDGFRYLPAAYVNQRLDPFSEDYVAAQLDLYLEIAGRPYDRPSSEHYDLDVPRHAAAANPYAHPDPATLATHIQRLSRALRLAAPPLRGRMLDMGCGWGLSSEVGAYLDLDVTAVDINPLYVDLVRRRAERGQRRIDAECSAFEDYEPRGLYHVILFYECLHHAVRPWSVIRRLARHLEPGGKIVLAGEPMAETWWTHWGLRLDPLSVYCIRKHGWFEAGWSASFIAEALRRAGLEVAEFPDPDPEIGPVLTAQPKIVMECPAPLLAECCAASGWSPSGQALASGDQASLTVAFPAAAERGFLRLGNFRPTDVRLRVEADGLPLFDGSMPPGRRVLPFDRRGAAATISIEAETWVPDAEVRNGDTRHVGIFVEGLIFVAGETV